MILIAQWEREKKESIRKFVTWFLENENNIQMTKEEFEVEYAIFLEQENDDVSESKLF